MHNKEDKFNLITNKTMHISRFVNDAEMSGLYRVILVRMSVCQYCIVGLILSIL